VADRLAASLTQALATSGSRAGVRRLAGADTDSAATTTAPSRLLVVTDRAFRQVLQNVPAVQSNLLKALSERLQNDSL